MTFFFFSLDDKEYDSKIALNAMKRINDSAKANGTSEMTLDEINEEINSYRKR